MLPLLRLPLLKPSNFRQEKHFLLENSFPSPENFKRPVLNKGGSFVLSFGRADLIKVRIPA
jgi:hypothetical protein